MATTRHYDEEVYGRMEFLAYFILIITLLALASGMYMFYSWLV